MKPWGPGEVVAAASRETPVAVHVIDLKKRLLDPWLGDMRTRTWIEQKPDLWTGNPMP